jgi:hypothetical protein
VIWQPIGNFEQGTFPMGVRTMAFGTDSESPKTRRHGQGAPLGRRERVLWDNMASNATSANGSLKPRGRPEPCAQPDQDAGSHPGFWARGSRL